MGILKQLRHFFIPLKDSQNIFSFSFYEKCFVVVLVVILLFRGKPVTLRDALFCLFQDLLRSTEIDFVKTPNVSRLRASLKMFTFPYFSVSS